jgi:hypothetical protein
MAFRTNKAIYYHILKTGGTWVREAMLASTDSFKSLKRFGGRKKFGLAGAHVVPDHIEKRYDVDDLFSFAFVRNPLDWYKSFWAQRDDEGIKYREKADRSGNMFPLDVLWARRFQRFIFKILTIYPNGFLTELYKLYVGEDGKRLDFVGRQENLRSDLITALTLAGEKFDAKKIMNLERVNVSASKDKYKNAFTLDKGLEKELLKNEKWILDTFYK